jgi:hypothetical protein
VERWLELMWEVAGVNVGGWLGLMWEVAGVNVGGGWD